MDTSTTHIYLCNYQEAVWNISTYDAILIFNAVSQRFQKYGGCTDNHIILVDHGGERIHNEYLDQEGMGWPVESPPIRQNNNVKKIMGCVFLHHFHAKRINKTISRL